MIPKIIHYCWFGKGKKNKLTQRCINSWKKYCSDYQIIEWNEDNFDVNQNPYLRWCYSNKKWAFLSDFVRLLVVNQYGGIYVDTDVEIVKKPDELLEDSAFYGFENDKYVASGLGFGAEAEHITVKKMIDLYLQMEPDELGNYKLIGCPNLNTDALVALGLECNGKKQQIVGAVIYPQDFFNPYDDATGKLNKTENTVSIHWYGKSWLSKGTVLRSKIMQPLHRIFGVDKFEKFRAKDKAK